MAVPGAPSVGSRALYFPFAVPAPLYDTWQGTSVIGGVPTQVTNKSNQPIASSVFPPDCGAPGVGLLAVVVQLGGSAPDYSGMTLEVTKLDGTSVLRSAGFASGQPMLNQATWVSAGSDPLKARWVLVDALS